MTILSLLYHSTSRLDRAEQERVIDEIVAESRPANHDEGITGALMFAQGHFAQLLEGEEAAVRAVMARIADDPRHRGVRVVHEELRPERYIPAWSLAYAGPSSFVAGYIVPLTGERDDPARAAAARRLIALMVEFSRNDVSRNTAY